MKKISIKLLIGIIAIVGLLPSCTNSKKTKVENTTKEIEFRYGYTATNSDVLSGLNGIALKQGYFNEEFKEVNAVFKPIPFVKAGPAINSALASGELEAGGLGDVPAIIAKAQNSKTTLIDIQPADYSTHLIVSNNSGIKEISELKGKKVAVQTGSYMQRILFQILEENGILVSDIELINMSEVDAATAIAAGSIDATAVTELKGVKLEQAGSAKLILDTEGNKEILQQGVVVTRTEFAEDHPGVIIAYFRALIRAEDYVKEHPEELRQLYIESGIEESILDIAYPKLSDYHASIGTTEESIERMEKVVTFLKANNLITGDVDVSEWYNKSFYQDAKKN